MRIRRAQNASNLVILLGRVAPGPGFPSAETCVNFPWTLLHNKVSVGQYPVLFILGEVIIVPAQHGKEISRKKERKSVKSHFSYFGTKKY